MSTANPRILQAIAEMGPDTGGPAQTVSSLCRGLSSKGIFNKIFTSTKNNSSSFLAKNQINELFPFLKSLYQKELQCFCTNKNINIIHSNGIWLPTNHNTVKVARQLDIPLIVSPHGMLSPWALKYKYLKKRLIWSMYQQKDLLATNVFCATSYEETKCIRDLGYKQPIAIIPNGVDIPHKVKNLLKISPPSKKNILFLSRIHPVKGLLTLVEAWGVLQPEEWQVTIVGPDVCGHREEVEMAIKQKNLGDSFNFVGPVYDNIKKAELFAKADLFVLPTFTENFGVAIAEALANKVPVITTKAAPWEDLESYKCGWWIDVGVKPLIGALEVAMSISNEEQQAMGQRGKALVMKKYSWETIAREMILVYDWVLNSGTPPECVITD